MRRKEMKSALLAGRYQPFHLGHLSVAEDILQEPDVDKLIIGIGSAQYSHNEKNPFTADERERMIRRSLHPEKPYEMIKIDDTHDNSTWISHVEKSCPAFDIVYTGNPLVKQLFEGRGYEVRPPSLRYVISATDIRKMMMLGDEWKKHVPQGTVDVIDEIDGVRRVRETIVKYPRPILVTDLVINYNNHPEKSGIVLIKRKDEPFINFWALPGGHFMPGKELIETAAVREAKEETSLCIERTSLNLLGVYSEPGRDPRGNYVSIAYYTTPYGVRRGVLKAGDDAKEIGVFNREELPRLAFDHNNMLDDYFRMRDEDLNRSINEGRFLWR